MRTSIAIHAIVLSLGALLTASARAECNCLYNGQRYEQEETVCMRTPQGMRLVRCGMLENIAWWQTLDQPCPGQVSQSRPRETAAMTPRPRSAASARPAAAWSN